jgi:glycosyltransferase involved in cell wall biosynthesis
MPTLDRGGAERFLVDLILNLDRQKYEPILILFKRGGDWAAKLSAENIPVIIFNKKYRLDLFNFRRIFQELKKFRPNIVHTQLGGDIYGRLAAKLLRVPVIISTEQNVNPDEKFSRRWAKRITGAWADKIIAISEAVRDDLIKRYQVPNQKINIIYNGIDIDNFIQTEKRQPSLNLIFGTLGRLEEQKGQRFLIEAWNKVKDENWQCQIGGQGSLAQSLNQQIKDSGLENRVKLLGPIANPGQFLKGLDIFLLPSLWEGLGIVLLEAGLSGLPIVASQVDGITEIIDDQTGWLVPAGNSEALAEKINWLGKNINDPLVAEKSQKLKNKIIQEFSIVKIASQYQDLYQDLIKQKNN